MSWFCGFCSNEQKICEQNNFCPRTILNRQKHILVRNEEGEETKYFNTASAAQAMKDYAEQVLLKENTKNREVLTEKTSKNEEGQTHLE